MVSNFFGVHLAAVCVYLCISRLSFSDIGRALLDSRASAFKPKSRNQLKSAVSKCLKISPAGQCPNGPHGPIKEWDVSDVKEMTQMFDRASSFNGDISKWDVSHAKDMKGMFSSARTFHADISRWDVSSVTNMKAMFSRAESFNGDISKWDVSSVQYMTEMFGYASSFNADISRWDVSSVIVMRYMFNRASSFTRTLSGSAWVHSKAQKEKMFEESSGRIAKTGRKPSEHSQSHLRHPHTATPLGCCSAPASCH